MELLANDLSFHEQFHTARDFHDAITRLMGLCRTAKQFRHQIYSHHKLPARCPMPGSPMGQVVGSFPNKSIERAFMRWMTNNFHPHQHRPGDWYECNGEIVTEIAAGYAASMRHQDVDCSLVSLEPTDWNYSPVKVVLRENDQEPVECKIENCWSVQTLEEVLKQKPIPISSWTDLQEESRASFAGLCFAEDCFEPLDGVPYSKCAADSFRRLLKILNRLALAFDTDGRRNSDGHRIYREFFTGDRAWFSDSSDSEKNRFRNELTFRIPGDSDSKLCGWHGKVRHQTLRLHFSWPIQAGEPVFVVYAGPKLTKK